MPPFIPFTFPDNPAVTVLFAEDNRADIDMATIKLPAGTGMPKHRHNGSDVIRTPVSGLGSGHQRTIR